MSVLSDREIKSLCISHRLVDPFDPKLINPASLDIRIGNSLKLAQPNSCWLDIDLSGATKDNPYWLRRHSFVLVASLETFNMPANVCGQFILKSSRGREGYQHVLAGWADPSWHGSKLTMELTNIHPYDDLPLYPGLRMGQMVFFEMRDRPILGYNKTGRYNNHKTAHQSLW